MNIKNCPFCGSIAQIETTRATTDGPGRTKVMCTNCKATVQSSDEFMWLNAEDSQKINSAIEKWNKRV
jgi:Lar family restriction alleviation protein